MMKKQKDLISRFLAFILVVLLLSSCGPTIAEDEPDLVIKDGWARTQATSPGSEENEAEAWKTPVGPLGLGPNGLIFLTIENRGGGADQLIKASAGVAEVVELHQMVLSGQQTSTYMVQAIDLPAHTVTEFKPGSYYIRLVGFKQALGDGSKFDLILEFKQSGKRTVQIVVGNP